MHKYASEFVENPVELKDVTDALPHINIFGLEKSFLHYDCRCFHILSVEVLPKPELCQASKIANMKMLIFKT